MNDRIKELVEQADLTDYFHWTLKAEGCTDLDKFAKLIVKECILAIEEDARYIHAHCPIDAIISLQKHFGVE